MRRMRLCWLALGVLLALAAPAAAADRSPVVTIPFAATFTSCGGTPVEVQGTLRSLFQLSEDASGGTHTVFTITPQDVRGQDLVTGTRYLAVGGQRNIVHAGGNGAGGHTFTYRLVLVSQGSVDNLIVAITEHATIGPAGEWIVTVERAESFCIG